jgi:hypothetical protein
MLVNVAPGGEPEDPAVVRDALDSWGRTARLCAIRLAEAVPAVAPVVLLILRH